MVPNSNNIIMSVRYSHEFRNDNDIHVSIHSNSFEVSGVRSCEYGDKIRVLELKELLKQWKK